MFSQYYRGLFPPRNMGLTVMRKQPGTLKFSRVPSHLIY